MLEAGPYEAAALGQGDCGIVDEHFGWNRRQQRQAIEPGECANGAEYEQRRPDHRE